MLAKDKDTGKGGSSTFELKIKPAGRGADVDKVVISDAITVDLPKPARGEDFFYVTDDNDLSRNQLHPASLELRDATPAAPTQFKEAK